jgi:glycosyltransferase involved in cell wall biosynthesis
MHIAILTLEFPPSGTGGLATHVAGLVADLRARGDRVEIFYLGDGPAPAGCLGLVMPSFAGASAIAADDLAEAQPLLARHAADAYDIVHCHDWHGTLLAASLWRRGVPLFTTCHLPASDRFHYACALPIGEAAAIQHLAMRLSTRVFAVSEFVKMELERVYRAFSRKIAVVQNGTDTCFFHGDIARPGDLILAVGRMTAQKGFDALPRILPQIRARSPGARLRLIGAGEDRHALHAGFRRAGVAEHVEILPFLDQDALRSHYREARVLALPSVYEPFGLVAIEAMACGTPVVAYGAGGPLEIVTSGVDGILVPPGDEEGFAHALADLIRDPALAQELGERAQLTARARFQGETCHARIRALYGHGHD